MRSVPTSRPGARERRYLALAALVIVAYAVLGATLNASRDFDTHGPLSYSPSASADVPDGVLNPAEALERCYPQRFVQVYDYAVVADEVLGEWHLACYKITRSTGAVGEVVVVNARGIPVTDVRILKAAGVWPRVAVVSSVQGLAAGFVTVIAVVSGGWFYYRQPRPGPSLGPVAGRSSWWQWRGAAWLLVLLPVISWILFAATRGISTARKARILFQAVFVAVCLVVASQLLASATVRDTWGLWVHGLVAVALLLCVFGGWHLLAPAEFDHPDGDGRLIGREGAASPDATGPTWGVLQPTEPADDFSLSRPELMDVAVRQFRAAARSRLTLSAVLRSVAIALAAFMFAALAFAAGVGFSGYVTNTTEAVFLALLLPWVYGWFFVAPAAGTALLALPLILGWRDPARLLLLRPFNRADHSRPLRGLVRREVAGYGHTYSLADVAIKVRWYITVPVLLGQLGLFSFRLRRVTDPAGLQRLAQAVGQRRRRNLNWAIARSKVFAVRCTDEVWQRAVWQMTQACDAVLIDVTDMTGNIAWELDLLREQRRLQDCLFLSLHGAEGPSASAVSRQLGFAVRVHGFDRAGRLVAPREFRHALAAIIFRASDRPLGLPRSEGTADTSMPIE